jgi:hypothetical protein
MIHLVYVHCRASQGTKIDAGCAGWSHVDSLFHTFLLRVTCRSCHHCSDRSLRMPTAHLNSKHRTRVKSQPMYFRTWNVPNCPVSRRYAHSGLPLIFSLLLEVEVHPPICPHWRIRPIGGSVEALLLWRCFVGQRWESLPVTGTGGTAVKRPEHSRAAGQVAEERAD